MHVGQSRCLSDNILVHANLPHHYSGAFTREADICSTSTTYPRLLCNRYTAATLLHEGRLLTNQNFPIVSIGLPFWGVTFSDLSIAFSDPLNTKLVEPISGTSMESIGTSPLFIGELWRQSLGSTLGLGEFPYN